MNTTNRLLYCMKKILFIDRDGTLIKEAPPTYQIDDFSKLEFYPDVFEYMRRIASELDYELVMVSNQDGMGTPAFPEDTFWPVQDFVVKSFENEGSAFYAFYFDRTFARRQCTYPQTQYGYVTSYLIMTEYDMLNSLCNWR